MKGGVIIVVFIAFVCCVAAFNIRATSGVKADESLASYLEKNHSRFVDLIKANNANLWTLITNADVNTPNFTIFAPTDKAVNNSGTINNIPGTLEYHVHTGPEVGSYYLRNYTTIDTLYIAPGLNNTPQVLSFTQHGDVNSTIFVNNQAPIIGANYLATNGIVHVVDEVIKVPGETVVEASRTGSYSILQSLVKNSNFSVDMNSRTFLAPTDVAFNALFESQPALKSYFTLNRLPSVRTTTINLLNKHSVTNVFYPLTLTNGTTTFNTIFGNEVFVNRENVSVVRILNAEAGVPLATVVDPNLIAANGVAHGISAVLHPINQGLISLADVLLTVNASNFLGRLNSTGLQTYLNDDTPHTYFVPTDAVSGVQNLNRSDLLYCISTIANVSFSGRFVDSELTLPSLGNNQQQLYLETVTVNNVTGVRRVNGIVATGPTLTNKGSYVYTINVLNILPGVPENVLNAAGEHNFTAFTELYTEKTLAGSSLYDINNNRTTLFVPTNAAFSKLPLGAVGYLRINNTRSKQLAVQVLNNHIVPNTLVYDITNGQNLSSANGASLNFVRAANGLITLNGNINVHQVPLLTENGAAFAIDDVIIPADASLDAVNIIEGLNYENVSGESIGTYFTSLRNYDQTGLTNFLESREPFTLFVYTDHAWDHADKQFSAHLNASDDLIQLTNILEYGLVYGMNVEELNQSNVFHPGNNTNVTLIVTQAGPDEKTKVTLNTVHGSYEATVVVNTTTSYGQKIYGLDRVLGLGTSTGSSGKKLATWAWVLIIVGGILIGLLILAVIVGAAWYLFVRPNREGYRHIN